MRTTSTIILVLLVFIGFQFIPLSVISVTGDSMHPTIPDGSLQLMHETNVAEENDIVIFQSQQAGDKMVIHRVESVQPGGLVTLGDNNEITDQAAGEPLVTPENVSGVAVTIKDQPIYVPYIGSVFQFINIYTIESILILLGGFGVYTFYREIVITKKQLGVLTQNDIVFPIFVTIFLGLAIVILIGGSTLSAPITYTTSDTAAQQQYVISVGEENPTERITFKTADTRGVETYVSSYEIIEINTSGEEKEILVGLPTRDSPGVESGYIQIYKFPPILPQSWLQSLTTISPLLPAVISSATLLTPLYLIFFIFGGPYQRVTKPRNRLVRKLYNWIG